MKSLKERLIKYLPILVFVLFSSHLGLAYSSEKLNVVASFSILGDLTERVGGKRIQVHTLVGPDADAHVYQATPSDAKALAGAKLVIVNGFDYEGWINRLIKSSGYRGPVLVAGNGVKTLKKAQDGKHKHHHSSVDPHAWQDLSNALRYVDNIAHALSAADPDGKPEYTANAEKYKKDIAALDSELRNMFKNLPEERRKVVSSHDAFAYFGHAYGLRFIAPVGSNTDAEPSAADVGRIIQQIRREKISAVFMESISDTRLLERIRKESGARIGGTLFSDSLSGKTGPASNYLDMMRHNARTLSAALAN